MSLCYDFQKWTMLSLWLVAISLSVGILMEYAHGYIDPEEYKNDPPLYNILPKYNELQHLRDYCFEHASDSANPVQDFIDKGLISPAPEYEDCKTVKSNLEIIDVQTAELLRTYPDRHNGELVPPEWD